ncbi:MAG: hypothetical protein ABIG39_06330 [Candidatus Micrarchaeota archaeon]
MRVTLFAFVLLSAHIITAYEIGDIREFDSSGFSEYPEIEGIRQDLLLSFYSVGRDNLPPGFPEFAGASVIFMTQFGKAYDLSSSGEQTDLLRLPETLTDLSSSLQRMEGLSRDEILLSKHSAYLARSLFDRYVHDEARKLRGLAESEARTARKLEYYLAASELFERSGDKVSSSEMRATYDSIKAAYDADLESADAMFTQGKTTCNDAIEDMGAWFGLPAYARLRECTATLFSARGTYVSHLEYERIEQLDSHMLAATDTMEKLSGSVMVLFVFGSILFISINVFLISRFRRWHEDIYDTSLGTEVLSWKGNS